MARGASTSTETRGIGFPRSPEASSSRQTLRVTSGRPLSSIAARASLHPTAADFRIEAGAIRSIHALSMYRIEPGHVQLAYMPRSACLAFAAHWPP